MSLAKMDLYDYIVLPGVIRIALSASNDPVLVDILSEIESAKGHIYADGVYYSYLDYKIYNDGINVYMELYVVENN